EGAVTDLYCSETQRRSGKAKHALGGRNDAVAWIGEQHAESRARSNDVGDPADEYRCGGPVPCKHHGDRDRRFRRHTTEYDRGVEQPAALGDQRRPQECEEPLTNERKRGCSKCCVETV